MQYLSGKTGSGKEAGGGAEDARGGEGSDGDGGRQQN